MSKPIGLFWLLAAAACAPAQVTLSTVLNGVATPVGEAYDFGSVPVGSAADVVFRLTNTGAQIYLTNLSVAGPGFSVACSLSPDLCGSAALQQLPILIGSGGTLDFTVQFQAPEGAESSNANMTISAGNTITTILLAEIVPGLSVLLGNQALAAGQTVGFGSVQIGSSQTLQLVLANQTNALLAVPAIPPLTGTDFSVAGGALSATSVPANSSVQLEVIFTPSAAGPRQATLTIGLLTYPLQGTGLAAPPLVFPNPSIQLNLATPASAQQGSLAVNLASAAKASGTGTLTLAFQPAAAGVSDDPTVTFADGTRSALFTVSLGASAVQFAGGPTVSFGTGTTAGTLTFTATLGSNTVQTTVTIPAAVIGIDAAVAARDVDCDVALLYCTSVNVELQINGWDNTRTTSQIVFTFYDASGGQISPGAIPVDAASAFQQYFAGSDLGGVFGVSALFPVNGSDPLQVTSAEVQLTNSAGTVQTAKIIF
jgi:hypothetical protein